MPWGLTRFQRSVFDGCGANGGCGAVPFGDLGCVFGGLPRTYPSASLRAGSSGLRLPAQGSEVAVSHAERTQNQPFAFFIRNEGLR
jgi:hypothetical protein